VKTKHKKVIKTSPCRLWLKANLEGMVLSLSPYHIINFKKYIFFFKLKYYIYIYFKKITLWPFEGCEPPHGQMFVSLSLFVSEIPYIFSSYFSWISEREAMNFFVFFFCVSPGSGSESYYYRLLYAWHDRL
jgi:hypothetical protein